MVPFIFIRRIQALFNYYQKTQPAYGGAAGRDETNSSNAGHHSGQNKKRSKRRGQKTYREKKQKFVDPEFLNKDGEKPDEVLKTNEGTENFTVGLLNIKRLTEIKWMNILEYMRDTSIDALVLTEHMRQDTDTPTWMDEAGYELYTTLGKSKKTPHGRAYIGGVALVVKKDTYTVVSKKIVNTSHLATCWTLESTSWAEKIHITGAYCSPDSRSSKQTVHQHTTDFFRQTCST